MANVDIQSGELLILSAGELVPALRATSALPGLLAPGRIDGRILVDGGVLNVVPVDAARSLTTAPVIAVDVSSPPDRKIDIDDDAHMFERLLGGWRKGERAPVLEVLIKASELSQNFNTRVRLATHPPQILVRPKLGADFSIGDFDRVLEAVQVGFEAMTAALDSQGEAFREIPRRNAEARQRAPLRRSDHARGSGAAQDTCSREPPTTRCSPVRVGLWACARRVWHG